jgi:SAM-dependent methyltransferase
MILDKLVCLASSKNIKMDQERHWDKVGKQYEDEIFDVFRNDKEKLLPKFIKKHADHTKKAIDFGCGIGKAFPLLSPAFKTVLATDISTTCLKQARQSDFKNITYRKADLTNAATRLPTVDFAFCCNVIMFPEYGKNIQMIRNLYKSLKNDGTAIVVVPSLESVLYASQRMIQWYAKEGVSRSKIPADELAYYDNNTVNLIEGIIKINGVPTKHYSEPEIMWLFGDAGFTITALKKIEYTWKTEFDTPPKWMGAPFPWDWLIECRKKGN